MNPMRERAIEELRHMVLDALGAREASVWLFGSCARGDPRQHSDIDIAILPRDQLPLGFFGELQADIGESTIPYDVAADAPIPRQPRARSALAPLVKARVLRRFASS
jgi:predicted nucleotidyltransferase